MISDFNKFIKRIDDVRIDLLFPDANIKSCVSELANIIKDLSRHMQDNNQIHSINKDDKNE